MRQDLCLTAVKNNLFLADQSGPDHQAGKNSNEACIKTTGADISPVFFQSLWWPFLTINLILRNRIDFSRSGFIFDFSSMLMSQPVAQYSAQLLADNWTGNNSSILVALLQLVKETHNTVKPYWISRIFNIGYYMFSHPIPQGFFRFLLKSFIKAVILNNGKLSW